MGNPLPKENGKMYISEIKNLQQYNKNCIHTMHNRKIKMAKNMGNYWPQVHLVSATAVAKAEQGKKVLH